MRLPTLAFAMAFAATLTRGVEAQSASDLVASGIAAYRALEYDGVFSLHRQPPSRDCPVGVNIETVLGEVLLEVDSAVEQVLGRITINDVVQRLRPCGAATKQTAHARNGRNGNGKANGKSNGRNGKGAITANGRKKQYDQGQIALSELRNGTKNRRAKALRPA